MNTKQGTTAAKPASQATVPMSALTVDAGSIDASFTTESNSIQNSIQDELPSIDTNLNLKEEKEPIRRKKSIIILGIVLGLAVIGAIVAGVVVAQNRREAKDEISLETEAPTPTPPRPSVGRFELRRVGHSDDLVGDQADADKNHPIAKVLDVDPILGGTVYLEIHENYENLGPEWGIEYELYGMMNNDVPNIPCDVGVQIGGAEFSFEKEEDMPLQEHYNTMYPNAPREYPYTTNGKVAHATFSLDTSQLDSEDLFLITDGNVVRVCFRMMTVRSLGDTRESISVLDTRFSVNRSYTGQFGVNVNIVEDLDEDEGN